MGGASSILEGARVYVSHSKDLDTNRLTELITRIERMNVQVSTFDKYNPDEFKTQIEQCQLVVVCIGADILKSYQQIRDYNEAITHHKKMVYLLMDEKYTYQTNPELNGAFPLDKSVICFEEAHLDGTVFGIQSMITQCI